MKWLVLCLMVGLVAVAGCESSRYEPGDYVYDPYVPPVPLACIEECAKRGLCAFDTETKECYAIDDAHCEASEYCGRYGKCGYVVYAGKPGCFAVTDEHCKQSEGCKEYGSCTKTSYSGGWCENVDS